MTSDRSAAAGPIDPPPKDFFQLLLVDDEPSARNLLRALLQQHGYTNIDEANDGADALGLLAKTRYDLVLLDKNMPGVDGLKVLAEGKKRWPDCEFIMLTAYGSMETAIQAMDLGAFSYVTKPFEDFDLILSRIDRALALVGVRRENSLMAERMRLLMDELEKAEGRLMEPSDPDIPALGAEGDRAVLALQAIHKLRKLASQIDDLQAKAPGKVADLFGRLAKKVRDVADLLEG